MCTVSFIPFKNKIFITSNRDENIKRGITIPPKQYNHNNKILTYPKDERGNGTWIGINEDNGVAVLLNGAFEKHISNPPYKQSRGFIIPYVLQYSDLIEAIRSIDLTDIEPFTLILFYKNNLAECRWNGESLTINKLPIDKHHIWYSSTLYNHSVIEKRKQNFNDWFNNKLKQEDDIFSFHQSQYYELELPESSAINNIKTISITQAVIDNFSHKLFYKNLLDD